MKGLQKIMVWVLALAGITSSWAFGIPADGNAETVDKILYNGQVITIDKSNTYARAVAIGKGRIVAVGTDEEILKLKTNQTELVDLQGKTLLPGFIDGHSHFMGLSRGKSANLSPPPMGTVRNFRDIISVLQNYKKENKIGPGEWISAFGYDPDQLEEQRHPAREDLDEAFPDNPVSLTHASGHMLVANSYALKLSGIESRTTDPPGGTIVRQAGSQEPTGLLQETAMRYLKRGEPKKLTLEEQYKLLKEQQELYASVGITTAQDGMTGFESVELLRKAASDGKLFIDIVALPQYATIDRLLSDSNTHFGVYDAHLKLGGFKITADGSPQGKTAFFSRPYLTSVPGCNDEACTGQPTLNQSQLDEAIQKGFRHNIHTFVHCNGDAAVDMYISAVKKAGTALSVSTAEHRPVVIHSQFVRPEQLDQYKELGFVPSFFTNHTFFWGDVHVRNLGKERAYFCSPLKASLDKGITFTNHTDFGITPIDQLFLLWSSVNRLSRTNVVIGPDQRVTPLEGLRAITINGAYQYFEEDTKGSIEKGKLADLVVVSENPLTIDPLKIKDIKVLETIKEGVTIYKRQ